MISNRIAGLILAVIGGYMLTLDLVIAGLSFAGAYMWSAGYVFDEDVYTNEK